MSFLDNLRDWFSSVTHHPDHIEVEVKAGDTLWDICKRASKATTNAEVQRHLAEVAALNPDIKDLDLIHPGEKIKLPLTWA